MARDYRSHAPRCTTEPTGLQSGRGMPQDGHLGKDLLSLEATLRRLDASEVKKLRQLEEENTRLRRVVADLTLDKEKLQEVIRRNYDARSGTRDDRLRARCVPGVDAQRLPNRSGVPCDVPLPFPPTRAGASQTAYPRDRGDTESRRHGCVMATAGSRCLLRREGWHVNVKRVHRLYRLEGLQMRLKPPRRRVMSKLCDDRSNATGPNSMGAVSGFSPSWIRGAGCAVIRFCDRRLPWKSSMRTLSFR
jgi:hypothetical protein